MSQNNVTEGFYSTLALGIPRNSWGPYIAEVYRVLKPGSGWAMFLEVGTGFKSDDGSLPEDSVMIKVWISVLLGNNVVATICDGSSRKG